MQAHGCYAAPARVTTVSYSGALLNHAYSTLNLSPVSRGYEDQVRGFDSEALVSLVGRLQTDLNLLRHGYDKLMGKNVAAGQADGFAGWADSSESD